MSDPIERCPGCGDLVNRDVNGARCPSCRDKTFEPRPNLTPDGDA